MNQTAKLLKIQGYLPARRCRRMLKAIEEERGIQILTKQGSGQGARYYTTEAQLRDVLPSVFQETKQTQETITSLKHTIQVLTNRLDALSLRVNQLERLQETKRG